MITNKDLVGLCITYNIPKTHIKESIQLHLRYFKKLYIVDNSDESVIQDQIKEVCAEFPMCVLISLGCNMGIAYALNKGCQKALLEGHRWILTLDQDSRLGENTIVEYLKYLNSLNEESLLRIGMLTCYMSTWSSPKLCVSEKVNLCWTSGALMNLDVYEKVGGFDEELFIDGVDFDLCAKMILNGFNIIRLNRITLHHKLGDTCEYRLLGYHLFFITHHNAVRRYYMTRNTLYLNYKYGKIFPPLRLSWWSLPKIILKIILFEKDKMTKLKYILKGYRDFKYRRLGKISK